MKHNLLILVISSLSVFGFSSLKKKVCDDCLMTGCIYQQINDQCKDDSDKELLMAVYFICNERKIKDSATINLIKSNYGL